MRTLNAFCLSACLLLAPFSGCAAPRPAPAVPSPSAALSAAPELQGCRACRLCGEEHGEMIFEAPDLTAALAELAALASQQEAQILDVATEHASVEERFLDIAREGTA